MPANDETSEFQINAAARLAQSPPAARSSSYSLDLTAISRNPRPPLSASASFFGSRGAPEASRWRGRHAIRSACPRRPATCGRVGSGGSRQVGQPRVALAVGRAVSGGLAAIAEGLEVARIAGRPAAGAWREIGDGERAFDRFLIGEIGGEGQAVPGRRRGPLHQQAYHSFRALVVLWREGKRLAASTRANHESG